MMNRDCFKAYDLRGRVPEDFDENDARSIGFAFVAEENPGTVVVGRDIRLESPKLAEALIEGIIEAGANVIDIGLCGTEEVYFQTFNRESQDVGGGIMITASHNPKGFNGMKFVRAGARPISGDTGLFAIRDRVIDGVPIEYNIAPGVVTNEWDKALYIDHILSYVDVSKLAPLRIVADPGNGSAGPVIEILKDKLPCEIIVIQGDPDGNFPNGVPNPLLPEMRKSTSDAVKKYNADFGIAWDGDFDRCFFFDEHGDFVEGYYIVGLLAEAFLSKADGEKVIHDPRLTWNTIDIALNNNGHPIQSKTGHAFIKERMRKENAVYGGEMSAHHYFRDFAYCDSGMLPWLLVAELLASANRSLNEMVSKRIAAFPCSGEINYTVENAKYCMGKVETHFKSSASKIEHVDGLSVELQTWRFNLRSSNTEPLLRLNVETKGTSDDVRKRVKEIETVLGV